VDRRIRITGVKKRLSKILAPCVQYSLDLRLEGGEAEMMMRVLSLVMVALVGAVGSVEAQGLLDGMLDRAKASAERKARDRANQRVDQTIDSAINKTEEAVKCVATDLECMNKAKKEGKQVIVNTSAPSDSVKCVITDAGCLKQAKAQGKKVEIVEEAELDTLRCAVTDSDCLGRAKSMGKKVEIID
jgi:hypothetical protein